MHRSRFCLSRTRQICLLSLCLLPFVATRSVADVMTTGEVTLISPPPSCMPSN